MYVAQYPISHKNQIITLGKVTPKYYSYTKAFKIAHARLTCLCLHYANKDEAISIVKFNTRGLLFTFRRRYFLVFHRNIGLKTRK